MLNIGTGNEVSVAELHDVMAGMCPTHVPPVHADERPGELLRNAARPEPGGDPSRVAPFHSFESGIAAVFEHFGPGQ